MKLLDKAIERSPTLRAAVIRLRELVDQVDVLAYNQDMQHQTIVRLLAAVERLSEEDVDTSLPDIDGKRIVKPKPN